MTVRLAPLTSNRWLAKRHVPAASKMSSGTALSLSSVLAKVPVICFSSIALSCAILSVEGAESGPNEMSKFFAASAPGQAMPTAPLRRRTGVVPSVPLSARPVVPAETRVPRASLRTIAPLDPGHSVSDCPARVRLEILSRSKRTGVQRRSAESPPLADQLPSIGSTKLSTLPPGKAPLTSPRPAKPIAPLGNCTSLSSGSAITESPARYGASAKVATPPPLPRRSNRPSMCGKPGPSLIRLPVIAAPPLPPNITVTRESAASRAPLPPRHSALGRVTLVSWPDWRI